MVNGFLGNYIFKFQVAFFLSRKLQPVDVLTSRLVGEPPICGCTGHRGKGLARLDSPHPPHPSPSHKKNPPSGMSLRSWGSPQFQEASLTGEPEIKFLGPRPPIRKWWYILYLSGPRQIICWNLIVGIFVQPHWSKVFSWWAWPASLVRELLVGPGWGCCAPCNDSLIIHYESIQGPRAKLEAPNFVRLCDS